MATTNDRMIEKLTTVAAMIGTATFKGALTDFARELLPHDSYLALRFHQNDRPDVLAEGGLADGVMRDYGEGVYRDDPFYQTWHTASCQGVLSLANIEPNQSKPYFDDYLHKQAQINDEIGILLPDFGGSLFGIFIERRRGVYGKIDLRRCSMFYPLIASLNRSHFDQIVADIRADVALKTQNSVSSVLVLDGRGRKVAAEGMWTDADCLIREALRKMRSSNCLSILLDDGRVLRRTKVKPMIESGEEWAAYFVDPTETPEKPTGKQISAADAWSALTQREDEIVRLILKGYPTALIAERLSLSIGTIKNYRSRLYYKFDITTERELIRLLSGSSFPS